MAGLKVEERPELKGEVEGYPFTLGEATFFLEQLPRESRASAVDLLIEKVAREILRTGKERGITFKDSFGKEISIWPWNTLDLFDLIVQENASNLVKEIGSGELISGLKVLLVTQGTFKAIKKSTPPPEWVTAYVNWSNIVVYNAEAVTRTLDNGNNYAIQLFVEGNRHELLHAYENLYLFGNDETMSRYFYKNSLWYLEGLKEAMSRYLTALPDDEFIRKLKEIRQKYSDFSILQVTSNFWQFDQSPTHQNICYQYCRRFMKHLTSIVNDYLAQKEGREKSKYDPYEGAYWVIDRAVQRYKAGKRESIIDVMEDELGLGAEQLKEIEEKWVAGLLNENL